jgi:hypothetical protein
MLSSVKSGGSFSRPILFSPGGAAQGKWCDGKSAPRCELRQVCSPCISQQYKFYKIPQEWGGGPLHTRFSSELDESSALFSSADWEIRYQVALLGCCERWKKVFMRVPFLVYRSLLRDVMLRWWDGRYRFMAYFCDATSQPRCIRVSASNYLLQINKAQRRSHRFTAPEIWLTLEKIDAMPQYN